MFKTKGVLIFLSLILIVSSVPMVGFAELISQESQLYRDVKGEDWFSDAVTYVTQMGLMNGTSTQDKAFSPYSYLTRAMLVTVLYRHAGMPEVAATESLFEDVKQGDWFYDAVMWAYDNGITMGMGKTQFGSELPVTREQAAVFIHRYVKTQAIDWIEPGLTEDAFRDASGVSDWAKEAVLWCQANGIIQGTPNHYFNPLLNITRGEIATVVHRFSEQVILYAIQLKANQENQNTGTSAPYSEMDSDDLIRVTFQTNGGDPIAPVYLARGAKLSNAPIPQKLDHVFQGWYLNEALSDSFYSDSPLYRNTTLYASFRERDYSYNAFVEPIQYLLDQDESVAFIVESDLALNSGNIWSYLTLTETSTQEKKMDLEVSIVEEGVYRLFPQSPYDSGRTYELVLLDSAVTFDGQDAQVRTLAFTIEKEEVYQVDLQEDIIYLTWDQVDALEEGGVFEITEALAISKSISTGKIICITDEQKDGKGVLDTDSQTRKVMGLIDVPGDRVQLLTEAASTNDLYDVLDIHVLDGLVTDALVKEFDLNQLEADLRNSENTLRFTQLLAYAVTESDTICDYGMVRNYNQNLTAMLDGLSISATIEETTNESFPQAIDNTWIKLTVEFDYRTSFNQVDIDASFVFVEYFTLNTGSTAEKFGMKLDAFNVYLDAYSQTEMTFTVLVKTASNDGYINITSEISNLIKGLTEDNSAIPTFLEEVLGGRGDYIPIAEIQLYKYTYYVQNPAPIIAVNFNIQFVVKINLALGLEAQATLMSARRIGVQGSETEGFFRKYDYALEGDNRQTFDLTCAGYLGVKAGIKLDLNVSFTGLAKLGKVGVSGEVGVYMDLWGYMQMHLLNDGTMDKPDISLSGGLYMELGIYVEIKLYAVSEVFKAKAELVLLDQKWPLYTLGDQYVIYRFNNAGKTIIMNENELDLKDILDIQILDLKTGKIHGGDYTILKNFEIHLSNPWFFYHEAYGEKLMVAPEYFGGTKANIHVPVGTEKLKTDLKVTYDGGSLSFSTGYFNEMEVIWVHPSVNPSDVNLGATHTATYQVTLDGVETVVATKEVLAGEVPGPVDLSEWLLHTEIIAFDAGYQEALWSDQTFNYTLEPLQFFMAYIYWKSDTWHYERYALEAGDTLILPEGYATSSGMRFDRWSMEGFTWNFEGSDLGTRVLTPEDLGYYKQLGFTHTGFDSGMQVENFSGTYSECVAEYVSDMNTIASKPGVSAIGQYDQEHIEITFMYPALTYYLYGNEYVIYARQLEDTYWYGTKPIASMPSYPYWIPVGWDADGDNVADYGYDNLPLATEPAVYRLKLIQDGVHTVTYRTNYGTFSNGEQEITFEGTYEACRAYINDFGEILLPVIENGFKYTFENWTEKIGPYTFEYDAVWSSESVSTSVTFDSGDGKFTISGGQVQQIEMGYSEGDLLDFTEFIQPQKDPDAYNTYTLVGWEDSNGVTYGLSDTPEVIPNMVYTAIYHVDPIVYTISISAGNGTFSDGTTIKTYSGGYLDSVTIDLENPIPPEGVDLYYYYAFAGWSSEFPNTFTEDVTIAATYNRIDYAYEITFDAGGGYFNEDPSQTQIVLEYTYGDSVVVPSNPEKPDSGLYGYEFIGWTPEVGSVTGNETYRAQYRTYLLEGEAVGITVSNGSVTEDISVGSLSEYVYDVSGDVPELQITTGSIVTISGVSSAIRIRIDETVTDVLFSDLTLTFNGALNYEALIIDGASRPLDILIEGNCVLENQVTDGVTVYANRETHFIGCGTAPNLSLEGRAYTLIYHSESLYFETMTLDGITHNGTTETGLSFSDGSEGIKFVLTNVAGTFASENIGFSGSELEFIDSSLSVQCAGGLGFVSALSVANSTLSMTGLSGLTAETLVTVTEGGPISILSDSGPALRAAGGISIADVYDLGSLAIVQSSEGGVVYYTLATYDGSEWIPASSIILQME